MSAESNSHFPTVVAAGCGVGRGTPHALPSFLGGAQLFFKELIIPYVKMKTKQKV